MQMYKLLEEGKSCSLYRTKYADGHYKYMIKDIDGDVIAMTVTSSNVPPDKYYELVKTYDIEKIYAEKRAIHKRWIEQFVEK